MSEYHSQDMSKPTQPHATQPPTTRVLLSRFARTHVCAQCWGPLVEKWDAEKEDFVVVCPKACQPGGFITAESAERRRAESMSEYMEAARNYPQLAPRISPEEMAEISAALFGE